MNSITFSLSIIFIPFVIPFVAFYVAFKMVLNGINQFLNDKGAEL
jgi:ABC-type sugar transport system permease subunit